MVFYTANTALRIRRLERRWPRLPRCPSWRAITFFVFASGWRSGRLAGKIVFQSSFMLTTVQPLRAGFVERLVELADVRLAVVGPFALGVGVVDDQARSARRCRRRSTGASAGRRRSCRTPAIGRRPMCRWMPTGLPALSSMKLISGSFTSDRLAVAHLELRLAAAADDLLGRNAIDLLRSTGA